MRTFCVFRKPRDGRHLKRQEDDDKEFQVQSKPIDDGLDNSRQLVIASLRGRRRRERSRRWSDAAIGYVIYLEFPLIVVGARIDRDNGPVPRIVGPGIDSAPAPRQRLFRTLGERALIVVPRSYLAQTGTRATRRRIPVRPALDARIGPYDLTTEPFATVVLR